MLFAINSVCSSPEFLTLDDFDFDFDNMSQQSSSSPGSDRQDTPPPTPPPLPSTMHETSYPTIGRGSPYSDDRSSMGGIRYLIEDHSKSTPEMTRSHLQAAPYNFPVNPESTLITPTSMSSDDPSMNSHQVNLPVRPRSQTPQNYQTYNNMYPNTSNPPRTSAHEEASYSPFHFYENDAPQAPPTPYWGHYNISPPSAPSPPRQPSGPVLIAPQPARNPSIKRPLEEDSTYLEMQQSRKRSSVTRDTYPRTTYPVERKPHGLNKEEQVLCRLKEVQKLPWKDITARWAQECGKTKNEAALQMQYKRLKERLRVWTNGDLRALSKAVQRIGNNRWEAISQTMLDFGIQEKWTRQACQLKWESLNEQELEMARELAYSPPPSQLWYDDRYQSEGSARCLTPDSLRGGQATNHGLGISPSQLSITHHDGLPRLPSYNNGYPPQQDWASYITH